MAHRAYGTRRARRRRRLAVLAIALLGIAAARALAMSGDDFPAHTVHLHGTPVDLQVQDGVSRADVRAVSAGVRAADRFLRTALGRPIRGRVIARIARGDPCPGAPGDRSVIGQGGGDAICIDTANLQWQWLVRNHPGAAASIPAHEYVHVLQSRLGCLGDGSEERIRWLIEGMAGQIGWQALVAQGVVRDRDVRRWIRRDGAFDPSMRSLWVYETHTGRTPQYARWRLAVRHLLETSRSREPGLLSFCARVGRGRPWRAAFLQAFGLSAFDFYARFEAAAPRHT